MLTPGARKTFTRAEFGKTLRELGLTPSAVGPHRLSSSGTELTVDFVWTLGLDRILTNRRRYKAKGLLRVCAVRSFVYDTFRHGY